MLSGDKRASLSSNLLDAKDAISTDGAANEAQQGASDVAKNDAKLRETVLYNKGAASASGFRPRQWSYEARPDDHATTVTPFPASASAPRTTSVGPAPTSARARLATIGVGAFSTIALITSASLFILSRSHGDSVPALAPVAPAPVAAVAADASPLPLSPPAPTHAVASSDTGPVTEPRVDTQRHAETRPPAEEKSAAAMPAPQPAPPALTSAEIQDLVSRGTQLLATGDIAAARVFFERAGEQGNAAAATAAGKTYDPLYLEEAHVRGIRGDPVAAAKWYRRASAAGDAEADQRMRKLIARYAG